MFLPLGSVPEISPPVGMATVPDFWAFDVWPVSPAAEVGVPPPF